MEDRVPHILFNGSAGLASHGGEFSLRPLQAVAVERIGRVITNRLLDGAGRFGWQLSLAPDLEMGFRDHMHPTLLHSG